MRLCPQSRVNGQNFIQDNENYYGKMWRNMVPLAKYGSLLYIVIDTKYGRRTPINKEVID